MEVMEILSKYEKLLDWECRADKVTMCLFELEIIVKSVQTILEYADKDDLLPEQAEELRFANGRLFQVFSSIEVEKCRYESHI